MKILTAAQMREVDRRTIERGIPGLVLMENAGQRVVELLAEKFAPLSSQRIVVLCGKGNNGGDGMVVARQVFTRFRPALDVVLLAPPEQLQGDAAENWRMLRACGCPVSPAITPAMHGATLVVDALLGTGIRGPAEGAVLEAIREINRGFPLAKVVAVDIPSGMPSDSPFPGGEHARADFTVTFTAPKPAQVLAPNCNAVGELRVGAIGSPPELYEADPGITLSLVQPREFLHLLAPRRPGAHKGSFGHVLVIGGSRGKTGAAAMAGLAALRSGAGLVTVASAESAIPVIAGHAPELMTEPLPETDSGGISLRAFDYGRLPDIAANKDVLAIGPGVGTHPETVALVRRALEEFPHPAVVDADALNALAQTPFSASGRLRVLTPHPGEMARLTGRTVADIEADRVEAARGLATGRQVTLVLKGQRSLIAFPDGRVWINPTGTPAMASGGSGDILTGLLAGFLGQFPAEPGLAVAAAVYLHGLAGECGARELGEKPLIATDLLRFLPAALEECARFPDRL
ncbi:MAG TPA: NAD(P)H-hydrate dehydratase [Bryobacteraceae bacterium]|nr:NAD(P)H-hydrate dehydratase [Bryobacteraceae bacterium]